MTTNLRRHVSQFNSLQERPKKSLILVEDRDTAERPAEPFGIVLLKLWIDGL